MVEQQQKQKRKKLNLTRLPPKNFEGKTDVIAFTDLSKTYNIAGRDEKVVALKSVSLARDDEFYPVKK